VKEIDVYSLSAVSDDTAPKGRISNPYTCHEFDSMMNNGTWEDGCVEEYGYMDKGVTITGTSEDSEDSYSWEDPWSSLPSDPWALESEDGSDNVEGQTEGGGSLRTNNSKTGNQTVVVSDKKQNNSKKDFPNPPSKINKRGVRIYSNRIYKNDLSTLSKFTVASYDEDGLINTKETFNGYFLERKIDYEQATTSGSNTAILSGIYNIAPKQEWQRYDWYLQNVPGRGGIAIHSGNHYYDSEGCLIIGETYTYSNTDKAYSVSNSRVWLNKLAKVLSAYGNDNIVITITENF